MGSKHVQAKSLKWQDPSKFQLEITGAGAGILSLPSPEILSMACQGVILPEINSAPVEDWIGEEWRFATGRLENYHFTITFKDFDNFTLYRKFANAMQKYSRMYPDDKKLDIMIKTSDDFGVDSFSPIATFKDTVLVAMSGSTLDNSAVASVAEFSTTFKCSYIEVY